MTPGLCPALSSVYLGVSSLSSRVHHQVGRQKQKPPKQPRDAPVTVFKPIFQCLATLRKTASASHGMCQQPVLGAGSGSLGTQTEGAQDAAQHSQHRGTTQARRERLLPGVLVSTHAPQEPLLAQAPAPAPAWPRLKYTEHLFIHMTPTKPGM